MANNNKNILNRIEYTHQQAYKCFNSANYSQNANWSQVANELRNYLNYAVSLYNQMDTQGEWSKAFNGDYAKQAQQKINDISNWTKQAEARANASSISDATTQPADARTSNFASGDLGTITQQLGSMFPQPYQGTDPTAGNLYDLYLQLLMLQQQYQWQQNSDDLAWSRTNPASMLQQLTALGMSRYAALGNLTAGATAGSSVGGALSPAFAASAAAAQQNQIAQQNANTQEFSATANAAAAMQQLANQSYDLKMRYWSEEQLQKGWSQIQKTHAYVYGMMQYHYIVPEEATISQTEFKKWLLVESGKKQCTLDALNAEYKKKGLSFRATEMYLGDDGHVYARLDNGDSEDITELDAGCDANWFKGNEMASLAYEEIKAHTGSIEYGMMFQQLFMNNAGPRAYHEQESASRLKQGIIACQESALALERMQQALDSAEMTAQAQGEFMRLYNSPMDGEDGASNTLHVHVDALLETGQYILDDSGRLCHLRRGLIGSNDDSSTAATPLTAAELADLGFLDLGMSYRSMQEILVSCQQAAKSSDPLHFQKVMSQLARQDIINDLILTSQELGQSKATEWLQGSTFLQGVHAAAIVAKTTGLDVVARNAVDATAFAVGAWNARAARIAANSVKYRHTQKSSDGLDVVQWTDSNAGFENP